MTKPYHEQTRECKYCSGIGKQTISWDTYTRMIISDKLKDLMKEKDISLEVLADKSKIQESSLREIINQTY
jgi:hypothetical protein